MGKIRILYKEPGKAARVITVENDPGVLRSLVGGYIEKVRTANSAVIAFNADGWMLSLPPNCDIAGVRFTGPIFIAGDKGDGFDDLPEGLADNLREHYPQLWEVE